MDLERSGKFGGDRGGQGAIRGQEEKVYQQQLSTLDPIPPLPGPDQHPSTLQTYVSKTSGVGLREPLAINLTLLGGK